MARLYSGLMGQLKRVKITVTDGYEMDPDVKRLQDLPRMADIIGQMIGTGRQTLNNNIAGAWWAALARKGGQLFRYKQDGP